MVVTLWVINPCSILAYTLLAGSLALAAPKPDVKPPPKPRAVTIKMREPLRFDPPRFEAKPGEKLVITLENADSTDQMHNFVLVQPGQLQSVVQQAMTLADKGPQLEFIPPGAPILAHSRLLGPDKTESVSVAMPEQKGIYPYVCTFPGHGLVMFGAAYVGEKMPTLEKDPNIPALAKTALIVGGGRRPYVQRLFLPDSGPASIAVALPGKQNFCWDAGACRLRYAWGGEFLDATEQWQGNGNALAKLLGKTWWRAANDQHALRIGSAVDAPKFLGYQLVDGVPLFRYRIGSHEVREIIRPAQEGNGVTLRFQINPADAGVTYQFHEAQTARLISPAGRVEKSQIVIPASAAADFTITLLIQP